MLPPSFGPPSTVFGDLPKDDKLSSGITIGYPVLRIKGKVWSITRGGNEPHVLMRPDGDGPRNSIDVVILAASQYVSKVWYEKGYEEGATNPPDCFSANGIVPDASSSKKQSNACATCPQGKWGSRITPAGKKAKACNDSKRVAVSPLGDIRNEAFGGPMMLRVPAASLTDFGNYGDGMDARGYKYFTIGTKMSFDAGESYPKLIFEPIRPLNDDEAAAVLELRESSSVSAILAEGSDITQEAAVEPAGIVLPSTFPRLVPAPVITPQVTAPPVAKPVAAAPVVPSDGFGSPEPVPPSPSKSSPRAAKKVQAAAPPSLFATPPVEQEVAAVAGSFEDTLDAQIENLLPGE
jgi:hypothetical protein